jgi:hypothetical protein
MTQGGADMGRVFPKYLKALLVNIYYRIKYQAKYFLPSKTEWTTKKVM